VEGAGAKAARIPLRRDGDFSEFLPIPADASGAYRQTTTEPVPGPPSLRGYTGSRFSLDNPSRFANIGKNIGTNIGVKFEKGKRPYFFTAAPKNEVGS
jgi:hypothetical protein